MCGRLSSTMSSQVQNVGNELGDVITDPITTAVRLKCGKSMQTPRTRRYPSLGDLLCMSLGDPMYMYARCWSGCSLADVRAQ